MTHVELDDQILNHPKFVRANDIGGAEPLFLWLGLRAYCSQFLSDGFIPDYMIADVRGPRDPKKRAAALDVLKTVKLVDNSDGGVALHDYLDWAPSRDQVEDWRRKARERKASSRGKSPVPSRAPSQRDSSRDSNVRHIEVTDTHTRGEGEVGGEEFSDSSQGSPEGAVKPKDPMGDSFVAPDAKERALFEAYREESGKPGVKLGDNHNAFLDCVRSGITAEQVREIVRGAKKERFAVDRGLVPSLILGTSGQREKYLTLARAAPPKPKRQPPQPNNEENPYKLNIVEAG